MALKITVNDLDNGRRTTESGSEHDLQAYLARCFPEVADMPLDHQVKSLNADGFVEVEVEADRGVEPYGEHNLLPEDYLTRDQGEDPWVREADLKS